MKRTYVLLASAALCGCFSPEDPVADTDPEDSTGSTTGGASVSASATTPTSGTESTSSATMSMTASPATSDSPSTTDPSETATTSSTGNPESSSSTAAEQLGPQLVMSQPEMDDMDAGIGGFFLLHFDRPVAQADALGNIFVTQDGGEPQIVGVQPCPPDANPQCVAGIFPESFTDPETNDLRGGTAHTIIVSADLPDLDGNTNTEDQVVQFRTFDFTNNFFDDSAAIGSELGGIAYDTTNDALFVAGIGTASGGCILRRINIVGGNPTPAATVAMPVAQGGGPFCYGMSFYEDRILLAMSYSGDVRVYDQLDIDDLDTVELIIEDPALPSPYNSLDQVVAVAQSGPRRFFSFGHFTGGGVGHASVLELAGGSNWSIFQDGTNLWQADDEITIATGDVGGTGFLFVHNQGELFKFRLSDGTLVDQAEVANGSNADLITDGFGRLYIGMNSVLQVIDGADLSIIEERNGLDTSRIAIDAGMNNATVYYTRYRDAAVIGRTVINFD